MGCGGTKDRSSPDVNNDSRLPKVSIRVDNKVQLTDRTPRVIFLFGGPGSKKGKVLDDVIHTYGFYHISVEDIILEKLPNKVKNDLANPSVTDIQDILKELPDCVTMNWLVDCVVEEMVAADDECYIIDIVPNLRYIQKLDTFDTDCCKELERFEQTYPVMFALNLAVPKDKIIANKYYSKPSSLSESSSRRLKSSRSKESGDDGAPSDEADVTRTQKRAVSYDDSSNVFLQYFRDRSRLVTVDVTCAIPDLIWSRVSEFLTDMNFAPVKTVNTVIVFSFDGTDFDHLDLVRYKMQKIRLLDDPEFHTDSMKKLLKVLCKKIDTSPSHIESFAVDVSGTTLSGKTNIPTNSKQLMFVDRHHSFLDQFIIVSTKKPTRRISLFPKEFKAVCSSENEVCLFPVDTKTDLCKFISMTMAELRKF